MKLATFVTGGRERFGVVLEDPASGEPWVFDPGLSEARLRLYGSKPTSALANRELHFLEVWPKELADFLTLGEAGMDALRRLQDTLLWFLSRGDRAILTGAGFPLESVTLRAPIPRPRLLFGLVQNSPTFIRNNPERLVANMYPQGHQRPQGSLLGPGDPVVVTPGMTGFCWTPEPAVVIGKAGRDIPTREVQHHIAGYTLVMDLAHDRYTEQLMEAAGGQLDWFEDATGSWLGKKSDAMAAMGPYLKTADEVLNPYDLLLTTRQSGQLRDRAHTGSMMIGFERLVSWLSSFMTLQPGDVLHMGTLAFDGMFITGDMSFGPEDDIEGELESVGTLRLPVVMTERDDWRAEESPSRRIHPAPAVRDVLKSGRTSLGVGDWSLSEVRHFWTVFGNYRTVEAVEGLAPRPLPRVLNAPASALSASGGEITVPKRAGALSLGVELALVIRRLAYRISEEGAADAILGYSPLLVLRDSSFADPIAYPATPQEANLPAVYARWADGFNVVSPRLVGLEPSALAGRTVELSIEGLGDFRANTDEYLLQAPAVLAFLTQEITLFPGDVVTLGPSGEAVPLPRDGPTAAECRAVARIEGLDEVRAVFRRQSAEDGL
ncbi:MAG: fumarylacetoacetate hydrolase family protein [Trueperaceae bacterium]|nr:MAG: fumarylacetoacetate hydrolase family protein [Trueperaceae bacterium]